jgi:N-methylhydantoinase A/oxoprolinase/acetone carboxylase beta subunit
VVIPAAAGVASAIGLLSADVKFDQARTRVGRLDTSDVTSLNAMFEEMEGEAGGVIRESSGAEPTRVEREVDLRYVGQGYEVTVPVPARPLEPDDLAAVRESFEKEYELRYGFTSPDQAVEATTWKVTAFGGSSELEIPRSTSTLDDVAGAVRETRRAYFPEAGGYVETPAYDRYLLFPGAEISGPAIVEERESTTVIPPGMTAACDEFGNLLVGLA